jgi:hypothetical protein
MEAALRILERVLAWKTTLAASVGEPLILAAAVLLFIAGLLVFYKKGPWLGLPISMAGILLILTAILGELFSF